MSHHVISDTDVKALKNLQVAFKVDPHGLLEIEQIEFADEFTGFYQTVDLDKYPQSAKDKIKEICVRWYNIIYSQTA